MTLTVLVDLHIYHNWSTFCSGLGSLQNAATMENMSLSISALPQDPGLGNVNGSHNSQLIDGVYSVRACDLVARVSHDISQMQDSKPDLLMQQSL